MRSQALGLAEAVGLPVEEKTVRLRAAWAWLPGTLRMPTAAFAGDPLQPPWPGLVIACGRRAAASALRVKQLSGGRTVAVYVQDPGRASNAFDLVAAMPHDRVSGVNVVLSETALHRVTPARLEDAAPAWRDRLKPDDAPLIGVLLGGDSGNYTFTVQIAEHLVSLLRQAHRQNGMRAVITPSRRTGAAVEQTLRTALDSEGWATIWKGEEPNPYLGILALADHLVVTGESISMISEALATQAPVHIISLEGRGRRHEEFLERVVAAGHASIVDRSGPDWSAPRRLPANATPAVAERVRGLLSARAVS